MTDYKLPPQEDEFISGVRHSYPKTIEVHIKDFTNKIQLSRTLHALEAIKRDVLRSDLVGNFQAKEDVRRAANMQARELGFKEQDWWA